VQRPTEGLRRAHLLRDPVVATQSLRALGPKGRFQIGGAQLAQLAAMDEKSSTHDLLGKRIMLGALALSAQLAFACGPPPGPFPPRGAPMTIDGIIVGVDNRSPEEQLERGLRVTVKPEGESKVLVDLAPGWYLNRQGLHFSERDRLSIQGISSAGDPVVLASRVTKGTTSVRPRDAAGHPLWDVTNAGSNAN
jgi:hypothetical protein